MPNNFAYLYILLFFHVALKESTYHHVDEREPKLSKTTPIREVPKKSKKIKKVRKVRKVKKEKGYEFSKISGPSSSSSSSSENSYDPEEAEPLNQDNCHDNWIEINDEVAPQAELDADDDLEETEDIQEEGEEEDAIHEVHEEEPEECAEGEGE